MAQPKPKCAICKHPEGKHVKGMTAECTVRVYVRGAFGTRNGQGRLVNCDCPRYTETLPEFQIGA